MFFYRNYRLRATMLGTCGNTFLVRRFMYKCTSLESDPYITQHTLILLDPYIAQHTLILPNPHITQHTPILPGPYITQHTLILYRCLTVINYFMSINHGCQSTPVKDTQVQTAPANCYLIPVFETRSAGRCVCVCVLSKFNGTSTRKGSYHAKTGDNDCNVNSSHYSLSTALCESIRYQTKSEQNVRQDPIPRVHHGEAALCTPSAGRYTSKRTCVEQVIVLTRART